MWEDLEIGHQRGVEVRSIPSWNRSLCAVLVVQEKHKYLVAYSGDLGALSMQSGLLFLCRIRQQRVGSRQLLACSWLDLKDIKSSFNLNLRKLLIPTLIRISVGERGPNFCICPPLQDILCTIINTPLIHTTSLTVIPNRLSHYYTQTTLSNIFDPVHQGEWVEQCGTNTIHFKFEDWGLALDRGQTTRVSDLLRVCALQELQAFRYSVVAMICCHRMMTKRQLWCWGARGTSCLGLANLEAFFSWAHHHCISFTVTH